MENTQLQLPELEFTVQFTYWTNNWKEQGEPEVYSTFEQAKQRADSFYCFDVEDIGNNCYINNGTQTWVEDFSGQRIYEPVG